MAERKIPRKARIDPETDEVVVVDERTEPIIDEGAVVRPPGQDPVKDIIERYGMTEEEVLQREAELDKRMAEDEARRAELAKRAPLLTKVFLKGKDYREDWVVRLKDDTYFKVKIRPIGDGDIYKAFDEVGIDRIPGPGEALVTIPQIKFARLADKLALLAIDTIGTGLTEQDLINNLAYGETTRLGTRIMSRLFTREAIESDRSPNLGSEAGLFRP